MCGWPRPRAVSCADGSRWPATCTSWHSLSRASPLHLSDAPGRRRCPAQEARGLTEELLARSRDKQEGDTKGAGGGSQEVEPARGSPAPALGSTQAEPLTPAGWGTADLRERPRAWRGCVGQAHILVGAAALAEHHWPDQGTGHSAEVIPGGRQPASLGSWLFLPHTVPWPPGPQRDPRESWQSCQIPLHTRPSSAAHHQDCLSSTASPGAQPGRAPWSTAAGWPGFLREQSPRPEPLHPTTPEVHVVTPTLTMRSLPRPEAAQMGSRLDTQSKPGYLVPSAKTTLRHRAWAAR